MSIVLIKPHRYWNASGLSNYNNVQVRKSDSKRSRKTNKLDSTHLIQCSSISRCSGRSAADAGPELCSARSFVNACITHKYTLNMSMSMSTVYLYSAYNPRSCFCRCVVLVPMVEDLGPKLAGLVHVNITADIPCCPCYLPCAILQASIWIYGRA